ncbi:MAG: glycogen debranching protein, partial [Candidatus Latescibacterota bacterium]
VRYQGLSVPLFAARHVVEGIAPRGFQRSDGFRHDGTTPVWTFSLSDALLEKRILMERGANTTYLRYDLLRAYEPLELEIAVRVNVRDHHETTSARDWAASVSRSGRGVRVEAGSPPRSFYLLSDRMTVEIAPEWRTGSFLSVEAHRGLEATDDDFHAAIFRCVLFKADTVTLVLSTDEDAETDGTAADERKKTRERRLIDSASALLERSESHEEELGQLVLAADQFIVARRSAVDPRGRSVLAGFPWFSDWGRDTMIALPGLALALGRPEIARTILRTFARYVDRGMLPNRFPDEGDEPEYNTVDATLWYFEAIRAYFEATGDEELLEELFPRLAEIVEHHERGTRFGIRVDPADGLLAAGEPGVQLTWMDAKVGSFVVTPRIGKPVEVNALWHNALRSMGEFARALDRDGAPFDRAAARVARSFERFWNEGLDYSFDVIDGPDGDDASLRPNAIFAVSLRHSPLAPERQKAIVDLAATRLVTPHGLRSLADDDPRYAGRYGGDRLQRDKAYHQGTVWAWLIGPFVTAHFRVYRDAALARTFLEPFFGHLSEHGLGSVSEIFDGDPPFTPRGCIAQAWSVAEILRAWADLAR